MTWLEIAALVIVFIIGMLNIWVSIQVRIAFHIFEQSTNALNATLSSLASRDRIEGSR